MVTDNHLDRNRSPPARYTRISDERQHRLSRELRLRHTDVNSEQHPESKPRQKWTELQNQVVFKNWNDPQEQIEPRTKA